jgi:alkaline phosphatase D
VPFSRAATDRRFQGVQSGDVSTDGGVVWARADRPRKCWWKSTTESFAIRVLPPIAALPRRLPAKMLLEIYRRQDIFYRVRFRDLASGNTERTAGRPLPHRAANRRDVSLSGAAMSPGAGASIR